MQPVVGEDLFEASALLQQMQKAEQQYPAFQVIGPMYLGLQLISRTNKTH
jgi:hypothetical protein